jgi:hypothetical protein
VMVWSALCRQLSKAIVRYLPFPSGFLEESSDLLADR